MRMEEFIIDNGKDKIAKLIVKLVTASYGLVWRITIWVAQHSLMVQVLSINLQQLLGASMPDIGDKARQIKQMTPLVREASSKCRATILLVEIKERAREPKTKQNKQNNNNKKLLRYSTCLGLEARQVYWDNLRHSSCHLPKLENGTGELRNTPLRNCENSQIVRPFAY